MQTSTRGIGLTGPGADSTVSDAAKAYLSTLPSGDPAQGDILQFVRWFEGDRRLRQIKGHDVANWTESLGTTSPLSERRVESVRAFLAYLKKQGATETNLATHIRFRRPTGTKPGTTASRAAAAAAAAERRELTPEGHSALLAELEELRAQRPQIASELQRAMADKDFRENSPLDAARDKQAHLEARIRDIEEMLRVGEVVTAAGSSVARLGSTVTLTNLQSSAKIEYTLVSPNEVNPSQGKISASSPVGKAVLDRRVGEEVEVTTPSGRVRYRVEAVKS